MTILGAAYGLSYLTQTRYDYNATKVSSMSKESELGMRKDRRKIDLREEYWRLATGRGISGDDEKQRDATWDEDVALLDADSSPSTTLKTKNKKKDGGWGDDWEPKRIARPQGTQEWGVPSNLSGASYVEEANNMRDYKRKMRESGTVHAEPAQEQQQQQQYDISKAGPPDARGNRTLVLPSGKTVVLGPDGKPCRACNTKLAFAEAMRGAAGSPSGSKKGGGGGGSPMAGFAGLAGTAAASSSSTSAPAPACPPDVEALGRSSWDLIHSIAATYPDKPTAEQQGALAAFFKSLPILYPCGYCAESLQDEYERLAAALATPATSTDKLFQNAAQSKNDALRFTCQIHNEVNARLGKKQWDCEDLVKLKKRWLDGGSACL